MGASKLTFGALNRIMYSDAGIEDFPNGVFLLAEVVKEIPIQNGSRHRLRVADGQYSSTAVMTSTDGSLAVKRHGLQASDIMKVTRFTCNFVQERKVLVIVDFEIAEKGNGAEIGKSVYPSFPTKDGKDAASNNKAAPAPPQQPTAPLYQKNEPAKAVTERMDTNAAPPPKRPTPNYAAAGAGGLNIMPISSLNPYNNKWKIRAKVMHKSDLRQWSNARGEGCLFSMDLADETGEIRATAFQAEAKKFHELIEEGGVYEIANGQLKAANKKYTSLKNDYELTFTTSTSVEASEASTVKVETHFEFIPITKLRDQKKDDVVDVIGIVQQFGDAVTLTSRAGKDFTKRDMTIIDESKTCVQLTLWGKQAENFDTSHENVCVAVKGCKVGDFNGCSLSAISGSRIEINPNITACHRLMVWWEDNKDTVAAQCENLSVGRGSEGQSSGPPTVIGITEANNVAMNGDMSVYFTVRAALSFFKHQDCFYKACPKEGCNKKVIPSGDGTYRCEKCDMSHDRFSYRLMLSAEICDATGSHWVSIFNDAGETLLGRKSHDLGLLQDAAAEDQEKTDEFEAAFNELLFKTFTFRIQAKKESYNDETRVKWRVASVKPEDDKSLDATLAGLTAGIEIMKTIESKS